MSGTPDNPRTDPPTEAETHYFRAIEDAFVRLRGAPLLLSPADFQVAARWHREGVPLRLVEVTLEEIFARRRERGAAGRINSLRYCAPAVDAAWAEVRALSGPGRREPAESAPVADRLAELGAALPPELATRELFVERIAALEGTAEEVEEGLRALDAELLAAAEAALEPHDAVRLDGEVEAVLETLRDRFPDDELVTLRGQLRRQRLRRHMGLPVLTLF